MKKYFSFVTIGYLIVKRFLLPFLALITLLILVPVWISSYKLTAFLVLDKLNLVEDYIPLSGTGSMYPTFPKGEGKTPEEQSKEIVGTTGMMRYPSGLNLFGYKLFSYEIERGDIVSFYNFKTAEITTKDGDKPRGFVKRVIALPADTLEIKDGVLLLNGKPQKEPYIFKARSTFGGEFLADCKSLTVPAGKLFVMGDNRKGSGDSRHTLGLIEFKDIDHVIPLKKQKDTLDKNWRKTDKDLEEISKIKLDKNRYLELLNQKRREAGAGPLRYQTRLETSAASRGKISLKYNDLSFEATRSGYTMKKALSDAGYSNITYGETSALGYYEAEELIENQFSFPDSKKFLLNQDFQDIGIAEVEGQLNGCPAQIVVGHLAGYVPPNYDQETINPWKKLLSDLKSIQPNWANLKEYPDFYSKNKRDIDRMNEIISQRINIASAVISKLEANVWLTEAENQMVKQDEKLNEEQDSLATKLNSL